MPGVKNRLCLYYDRLVASNLGTSIYNLEKDLTGNVVTFVLYIIFNYYLTVLYLGNLVHCKARAEADKFLSYLVQEIHK